VWLIQKWLNAGVLEHGKRIRVEERTPQGGSASPLLANVYLHYVFDLWVQAWRRKRAHGDVIVVRFADDIVVGFREKADADQFRAEPTERMKKFNLELHPEKTRLLEFGPFAIQNRKRRGEGKPETFNFLGFTHICVKKRSNGMNQPALFLFRFQVGRLWYRAPSRRSQKGRVLWDRMRRLITRWLPPPTICHPYPLRRMGVLT
jgi:hypothetical protein